MGGTGNTSDAQNAQTPANIETPQNAEAAQNTETAQNTGTAQNTETSATQTAQTPDAGAEATPVDLAGAETDVEETPAPLAAQTEAPETMKFAQGFDLTGLGSEDAGDKLIYAVKSDPNFGKTKKIDLGTLKIDGKVTKEQLRSIVKVVSIDTGVPVHRIKVKVEGEFKNESSATAVASADAAPETATVTEPDRVAGSGERAEEKSGPVKVVKTVDIGGKNKNQAAIRLVININKQARDDGNEKLTSASVRVKGSPDMTEKEWNEVVGLVADSLEIEASKVDIDLVGVKFKPEVKREIGRASCRERV